MPTPSARFGAINGHYQSVYAPPIATGQQCSEGILAAQAAHSPEAHGCLSRASKIFHFTKLWLYRISGGKPALVSDTAATLPSPQTAIAQRRALNRR